MSTRSARRRWFRGFTLAELLVVIALIAVLSGFLVPILDGLREEGRRTVCLSHLRQIGQAHLLYLQDWDDHLPEWHMSGPPRPEPFGILRFWTEYFQPYLRSPAILHDPSAAGRGAPPDGAILADYVLLTWGPGSFGGPDPVYFRWPGPPLSLGQVRRPAETFVLMDGWTTTGRAATHSTSHGGGSNVSFVDGHARWLSDKDLWRVDTNGRGSLWLHYRAADR
jgi:prepilin-type N-terminal cleavage/methylation domain-containing protein/prepilin-type processing-associated H-X9-DG protein